MLASVASFEGQKSRFANAVLLGSDLDHSTYCAVPTIEGGCGGLSTRVSVTHIKDTLSTDLLRGLQQL
jgi:hypothetical protein